MKEILRLVDESQFDEFELETPNLTIRFRRGDRATAEARAAGSRGRERRVASSTSRRRWSGRSIARRAPGEAPFVELGSPVEEHTQVCILEVMKLMSSVVAGARGVVAEVCHSNGEAVQYGDVLFRIRPS